MAEWFRALASHHLGFLMVYVLFGIFSYLFKAIRHLKKVIIIIIILISILGFAQNQMRACFIFIYFHLIF